MVSRLPQALQRIAAIRAALGSMEGQVPLGGERPAAVGRFADVLAGAMQASASGPQARAARCPADVSAMVEAAARRFGLSADLIHAVIRAESDYDPGCTSPAGAMGLMQLMPGTARALGVHDPYDPLQNIMGGSRYLREQLDRFGSLAL
ncbi:MAG: lytic transglycosylase domain-containing protein, partial [Armatimonadota bacterium]